jgi:hypothetical protein
VILKKNINGILHRTRRDNSRIYIEPPNPQIDSLLWPKELSRGIMLSDTYCKAKMIIKTKRWRYKTDTWTNGIGWKS